MHDSFVVWPVLIFFIAVYTLFLLTPITIYFFYKLKKASKEIDPYDKYSHLIYFRPVKAKKVQIPFLFFMITTPFPGLLFYFIAKSRLQKWRNEPRTSEVTGLPMRKLSEKEEDLYLKSGQLKEEELGSLDHDVWISEKDGDILILSYNKDYSNYNVCPHCNSRTAEVIKTSILKNPTYTEKGMGVRNENCLHCLKKYDIEYEIDVLVDDSDDYSTSFDNDNNSNWEDDSSHDSWGGGSSGGGGAGSNW